MMTVEEQYRQRFENYLEPIADRLRKHLNDRLGSLERIDRISIRAKAVDRFVEKALRSDEGGTTKYSDPLNEIQDQIGARIVTFYLSDISRVAKEIERYYAPIEARAIVPDSPREFDYEGMHYIMLLPDDIVEPDWEGHVPEFFELQVKTLFQHAWGEANHDLGYKPARDLERIEKRKIAFTSAQAWGADHIFDELHSAL